MSTVNLGRLEQVELREAWLSEAGDFTPWLAREDNLALLGEAIGLELELEAQEKDVGPFRADLLCKDTADGHWVLIENQLEKTDHTHLGQLMTYAAGLKAVTIVWVAYRFTDEHRAALDWLNEITNDSFTFFGLEVELWRIGTSPMAPKFNVVCKPNDWTRIVANETSRVVSEDLTPAKQLQFEFWQAFREHLLQNPTPIKPTKPLPQHWMSVSLGRTGVHMSAVASTWDSDKQNYDGHELRAEVVMDDQQSKAFFGLLKSMKRDIEAELKEELIWHNPEEKKMCRIYLRRSADLEDRTRWPEYQNWLRQKLEDLHRVFGPRVKRLDPQDWESMAKPVASP